MSKEVTVIVATHKKYRMPDDVMYLPVYVGAFEKDDIGYQRDDEGENISGLNAYFCEMTGVYWAWKNLKSDYVGLVHYRRQFSSKPYAKDRWGYVLKKADIENDLGKIKVFVPGKRRYWIESLYSHYEHTHHIYQLDETRNIIENHYPGYVRCFDRVCMQRWGYMFNMMIMERSFFSSYCEWVFGILFELKKRLGEDNLSPYHNRFYGRISEILFNVWLSAQIEEGVINQTEIKEIPIVHMEKVDWWKKGKSFLEAKFLGKKYSGSF